MPSLEQDKRTCFELTGDGDSFDFSYSACEELFNAEMARDLLFNDQLVDERGNFIYRDVAPGVSNNAVTGLMKAVNELSEADDVPSFCLKIPLLHQC